jgi:hypothetical protein
MVPVRSTLRFCPLSLFLFKGSTYSPREETTDFTDETDVGKAEDTLCSRVTLWIHFL